MNLCNMRLWRNLSRAFYVQMFSVTALTQLKRFWFKVFCFGFFPFLVVFPFQFGRDGETGKVG